MTRADGARAARSEAQSLRTPGGEPVAPERLAASGRPDDRRGDARQPARRAPGRERPPHRRLRLAESVPVHVPSRHERGLDRRRRLIGSWEEIDRIVDPLDADRRNVGWPCYEGAGQHGQYKAQNLAMCDASTRRRPASRSVLRRTTTTPRSSPARPARPGVRSISGIGFYDGRDLPGHVPGCAVLRRSLAELHLGDEGRRQRAAGSDPDRDVRRRGGEPGRDRGRARRRSLLCRLRGRSNPSDHVPGGQPDADAP